MTETTVAPCESARELERQAVGSPDDAVIWDVVLSHADQAGEKAKADKAERRAAAIAQKEKLAAEAEDIAATAVFLCSPAARYINGAIVPVDGGWLAR